MTLRVSQLDYPKFRFVEELPVWKDSKDQQLEGVAKNLIMHYNDYSQFAIKIVLATNDNTNVPFLTDIRALALPSGSGI